MQKMKSLVERKYPYIVLYTTSLYTFHCYRFHEDDSKDNYYLYSLLVQMEADIVIIPSNTSEKLKQGLMSLGIQEPREMSDTNHEPCDYLSDTIKPFKVECTSSSSFSSKQVTSTFEHITILGLAQELSTEAKMAQLGLLDQNLPSSILAALAGLLSYIQKAGVVYTYKGSQSRLRCYYGVTTLFSLSKSQDF